MFTPIMVAYWLTVVLMLVSGRIPLMAEWMLSVLVLCSWIGAIVAVALPVRFRMRMERRRVERAFQRMEKEEKQWPAQQLRADELVRSRGESELEKRRPDLVHELEASIRMGRKNWRKE